MRRVIGLDIHRTFGVERNTTANVIDRTIVRAYYCAIGLKKDQEVEGLGRSRGGFIIKLHAHCDNEGRPLCFVLAPRQAHGLKVF